MGDWSTVACLLVLRDEFNTVAPKRDKGADGTIGDLRHAAGGTSDHLPDEDFAALRGKDQDSKNEVHALDIDSTGPWPDGKGGQANGWFDRKVHEIIERERRRWLDPNDVCRLEYVIWRGMIYSRSHNFVGREYTGSDPHFNHAHFSARYLTQAESDTRPWGVASTVEDDDMPLSDDDLDKIASRVWNFQVVNPYLPASNNMQPAQTPLRYAPSLSPHTTTHTKVDGVARQITQVLAMVTELAGKDFVDEAEISASVIQGVLQGMAGAEDATDTIANAVLEALPEELAEDVANKILAKQGQAMVDAAGEVSPQNG